MRNEIAHTQSVLSSCELAPCEGNRSDLERDKRKACNRASRLNLGFQDGPSRPATSHIHHPELAIDPSFSPPYLLPITTPPSHPPCSPAVSQPGAPAWQLLASLSPLPAASRMRKPQPTPNLLSKSSVSMGHTRVLSYVQYTLRTVIRGHGGM